MLWSSFILLALAGAGYWWWRGRAEEGYFEDEAEEASPHVATLPAWQEEQQAKRASVEALQNALKSESTEHGRIILEWLRKLRFKDMSIEEAIGSGTPDERSDLKAIFKDVVDTFDDFKARLVGMNPMAQGFAAMKRAEKIAESFRQGIAILAKLEIANSIADSMQISASASQSAQDKMSKLMADIQKAMEETLAECERQQELERQQEAADHAAEQQSSKRKRRRRRRQFGNMASAKGASKRVNAGDLNGDGVADSLQGLSRTKDPIRVEKPSFENIDLQQIRDLGKVLSQNGGPVIADVKETDKISGDDRTMSEQEKLKREREKNGPAAGM